MAKSLFIFLIFFRFNTVFAQSDSSELHYNIDSLNNIYGKHKHFINKYKLVSLIALSYYPELIDEQIKFKYANINSTARTTMSFFSVFWKESKHYIIYINNNIKRTGMLPEDLPFDAQVALVAHELAHVIDFKKRGFISMCLWGVGYTFVKQRAKIEKRADETVIKRGLGQELYDLTDFILNHSSANNHYLEIKRNRYLLPSEIMKLKNKYAK